MDKTKEQTVEQTTVKKGNKIASVAKKVWYRFKILMILLIVVAIAVGAYVTLGSYSIGYRAGNVMKLSKKGVVFKTWEGELNVGGLQEGSVSDVATTVWEFSVSDENIVKDIEKAVDNNSKVKLRYEEKYFQLDFFGDTKYFITAVEELE